MVTAQDMAAALLRAAADGTGPAANGWLRDDRHGALRQYQTVTVTDDIGLRHDMARCPHCGTLWPMARGIQTAHIVPARTIQRMIRAQADGMGIREDIVKRAERWARRYVHPANVTTACYACNDDHETTG